MAVPPAVVRVVAASAAVVSTAVIGVVVASAAVVSAAVVGVVAASAAMVSATVVRVVAVASVVAAAVVRVAPAAVLAAALGAAAVAVSRPASIPIEAGVRRADEAESTSRGRPAAPAANERGRPAVTPEPGWPATPAPAADERRRTPLPGHADARTDTFAATGLALVAVSLALVAVSLALVAVSLAPLAASLVAVPPRTVPVLLHGRLVVLLLVIVGPRGGGARSQESDSREGPGQGGRSPGLEHVRPPEVW
jgi:hypothetical protein